MDIRKYFGSDPSTGKCAVDESSEYDSSEAEIESNEQEPSQPTPSKKRCTTSDPAMQRTKWRPLVSNRKYSKKWEKQFTWLEYDEDQQGTYCKTCRRYGKSSGASGGTWVSKPFYNWKKATEKMRTHAQSNIHQQSCEAELAAARSMQEGSIIQQLQQVEEHQRLKNRAAIKALLRCTHFLVCHHIPHTTNFEELIDLVVSCGAEDLKSFNESAGKNATYLSKIAVVEFIDAIGLWAEESLLKRLCQAPFYSIMADECTDVSVIEELSIYCRWVEKGVPVEHFLEIVPLKKADALSIYTSIIGCLTIKTIPLGKLIGMGFDGAAAFSGKHSGVQSYLKKNAPHALFVHCHCHLLQLACVQAANGTTGIKHVYTTLITLWKFFQRSPKRCEILKEVYTVLNLPELKIIKPSDTRWLAHERCIKAVKSSYSAIVSALVNIYEETHEPEALGLSKALCNKSTIMSIYLLDYVLPQVAKLSRTLQMEALDLTAVSSLVDSTLHSLDDSFLPAANWVLELLDHTETLEGSTSIKLSTDDIHSFQEKIGTPFVQLLKQNISSRFTSQDVVSAFSIFEPKKIPNVDSPEFPSYGDNEVAILTEHYGQDKSAETTAGKQYIKEGLISTETATEWKTYRHYLSKQTKDSDTIKKQLKDMSSETMMVSMFPNLSTLANICLTIPVSTASVERSFSQMKMIKTRLRNRIGETSLSSLMKIAMETPRKLSEEDLENIIEVWKRKPRRIVV